MPFVPDSLRELAAALVAIDSANPALVPGGAGEHAIASFVAEWCLGRGFEVEILGEDARGYREEVRGGRWPVAAP